MKSPALLCCLAIPLALMRAEEPAPRTAQELWAGYDPRAEPLEIAVAKTWVEGAIRLEQLSFTGETWEGKKVRVFAYRAAPAQGEKLPGMLHLHGGGQTASLAWVRYWAGRGYVCVSHDFCGSGPGRAPETVTQWGAAPAYMADPNGPRSNLHPTARFNSWYHWTLAQATHSPMLREVYTPRSIHHLEPAEAQDLALWMDFHLKGIGPAWPESPKIEVQGGDAIPRLVVTVAQPGEVESVTAHYGLDNPWPTSRFYRAVAVVKVGASSYAVPSPILAPDDTIYAFANVAYRSGIHLSTRLVKAAARDLPAVRPTLQRTALIDAMDDDRAWFWWLAGTDPLNQTALLQPWTGPRGERGFTHAQPGGFSFATAALGDPQFKSGGTAALLLDVWAEAIPASLEVTVATKFFQPGQINCKAKPKPGESKDGWVTLRLLPSDFHDDKDAPLASWKDVDFLCLSGTGDGLKRTVFKNLRWEKPD